MTPSRLEVVDLVQQMIRNECVNDGSEASGHETRSADLLLSELEGSGADFEVYEPTPGRSSLVGRIEGTDKDAPSICWLGHTDVVPANPDTWSRDPFGGELVDGEVWGRGAVDMLNLTASMSVAFDRLARSGFRPKGTLVLVAVADEEALGIPWRRLVGRTSDRRREVRLRDHRDGRDPARGTVRQATPGHGG